MQINLARKWRSRRFEELIGQPLVVRMLKNSLYRDIFFPVYLLTGTRGCGKTTIARIFASAVNCYAYDQFKSDPQKVILPCLECSSCKAMLSLNHPDFIEIDAASHTGVDNIRQISESASFVPAMSRKKIYLIDEAHMLSKAAFNAFLKLLEEPPATACFILATTEINKIPETVKSRCLQLFFYPVNQLELSDYLSKICKEEKIGFERSALLSISAESGGSVRDAINLIERVKLVSSKLTSQAVADVLGSISSQDIITLIKLLLSSNSEELFLKLESKLERIHNSTQFWSKLTQAFIFLVNEKQKLNLDAKSEFSGFLDQDLKLLINRYPIALYSEFINLLVHYESLLFKSSQWQLVIRVLFIKMSDLVKSYNYPDLDFNKDTNIKPEKKTENNLNIKNLDSLNLLELDLLDINNKNQDIQKPEELNYQKLDLPNLDQQKLNTIKQDQPDLNRSDLSQKNFNQLEQPNLLSTKNKIDTFGDIDIDPDPSKSKAQEISKNNLQEIGDSQNNPDNSQENLKNNSLNNLQDNLKDGSQININLKEWPIFITELGKLDKLLCSLFSRACDIKLTDNKLEIIFEKHLNFYKDTFNNAKQVWHKILNKLFERDVFVELIFTVESKKKDHNNLESRTYKLNSQNNFQDSSLDNTNNLKNSLQDNQKDLKASAQNLLNSSQNNLQKDFRNSGVNSSGPKVNSYKNQSSNNYNNFNNSKISLKAKKIDFSKDYNIDEYPVTKKLLALFPGNIQEVE